MNYILQVLNKRSEISTEDGKFIPIMGKDVQKEWFDDMSEALTWMTTLAMYLSPKQRRPVLKALSSIKNTVEDIVNGYTSEQIPPDTFGVFSYAYEAVIESAIGHENVVGFFS